MLQSGSNAIFGLMVLLLCSCTGMEIATNAALLVDMEYTKVLVAEGRHEHNPLLGRYPSQERIKYYFAGCILSNTILHRYLPKKYLTYYQTGLMVVQVGCIANNYSLGVRVKF